MKIVTIAAVCALGLSQVACANLVGTGGSSFDLNKFLTDQTCAHDDKIQGVSGAAGIPASLQFSAERHCPGNQAVTVTNVTPPPK